MAAILPVSRVKLTHFEYLLFPLAAESQAKKSHPPLSGGWEKVSASG